MKRRCFCLMTGPTERSITGACTSYAAHNRSLFSQICVYSWPRCIVVVSCKKSRCVRSVRDLFISWFLKNTSLCSWVHQLLRFCRLIWNHTTTFSDYCVVCHFVPPFLLFHETQWVSLSSQSAGCSIADIPVHVVKELENDNNCQKMCCSIAFFFSSFF